MALRPGSPELSWRKVMDIVLPPKNGQHASVTSGWGRRNITNGSYNHQAIDFVYPHSIADVGKHLVHSPVNGTVEYLIPSFNGVVIRDADGLRHELLHHYKILVERGQSITRGQPIGILGGFGNGRQDYRGKFKDHVHYQLRDPKRGLISAIDYWNKTKQTYVKDRDGVLIDSVTARRLADAETEYHNQDTEGQSVDVAAYRPRMAAISGPSEASVALLPNRVPNHEPWPRVMHTNTEFPNAETSEPDYNTLFNLQLNHNDPIGAKLIGRLEGEETIERGPFWRR